MLTEITMSQEMLQKAQNVTNSFTVLDDKNNWITPTDNNNQNRQKHSKQTVNG